MVAINGSTFNFKDKIKQLCSSAIYKQNVSISVEEVIIFKPGCHIPALAHIRMLILSRYVLLACINALFKLSHLGELVRYILVFNFWTQDLYTSGLKCARKV